MAQFRKRLKVGRTEILKDKKKKIAKETREFNKKKQAEEDAKPKPKAIARRTPIKKTNLSGGIRGGGAGIGGMFGVKNR